MKSKLLNFETIAKTLIILAPFILFGPALIEGKVLYWGVPSMQFIPWRYLAFEGLKQGFLPLWNPYNGMGAPLLANYQLAFFYPPGWLSYFFAAIGGISWLAWSETLLVPLHLSWAAAGMIALQKRFQVNITGQLVSALAFSLSGYLIARVGFFPLVFASVWLPWIFLLVTNLCETLLIDPTNRRLLLERVLILVLAISMQFLVGHAQVTLYTIMLSAMWIIYFCWRKGGIKKVFKPILFFSFTVVAACLVTAVQLLPTLEFLRESQRSSNVDYVVAMVYSFWPWRFLTFLFPNFFGNPGLNNYWGYANFWEDAVYIGLLPFIAALGTGITLIKSWKHKISNDKTLLQGFLWGLIIVGFILALGINTPVFPFLYQNVPTFNMFNGPSRFLIWVVFSIAILAGFGVEIWKKPAGRTLKWTRLSIAASAAVTIGAILSQFYLKGVNITFIPAAAIAGGLGVVAAILALTVPNFNDLREYQKWSSVLLLFVLIDLCIAGWNLNPVIDKEFYRTPTVNNDFLSLRQTERTFLSEESEYILKFDRFFKFRSHFISEDWNNLWSVLLPDTNILSGTMMVNNFDPLQPSRFARIFDYLSKTDEKALNKLLTLMSVNQVETVVNKNPMDVVFTPIKGLERFRWYTCAFFVDNEENAWFELRNRALSNVEKPFENDLILETSRVNNPTSCANNSPKNIRIVSVQPQKIIIEVESSEDGWLEDAETWYPGWTATVDSNPTEVLHSNYIFRAVRVFAGKHIVTFTYSPSSLFLGELVTVVSLIIVLFVSGMIVFYKRKQISSEL